jgi:hypothetical protein
VLNSLPDLTRAQPFCPRYLTAKQDHGKRRQIPQPRAKSTRITLSNAHTQEQSTKSFYRYNSICGKTEAKQEGVPEP